MDRERERGGETETDRDRSVDRVDKQSDRQTQFGVVRREGGGEGEER